MNIITRLKAQKIDFARYRSFKILDFLVANLLLNTKSTIIFNNRLH